MTTIKTRLEARKYDQNWQRFCQEINQPTDWLVKKDLQGADLREVNLQGANLQGANLEGADLRGAILEEAKLQKANLRRANLEGANLEWAELAEVDLREANLKRANLQDGFLFRVNLQGADLQGADLRDTDLEKADLRGAKLERDLLHGANLQGANLQGAEGVYGIPLRPFPGLARKILDQIQTRPESLDQMVWHSECGTKHCCAGWAVVLAGEVGAQAESILGTESAAKLLLGGENHPFDPEDNPIPWLEKRSKREA